MKNLHVLGRILFGLSLLVFAVNPLLHANETAEAMPIPVAALPLAYLSGFVLLAGGLSLILNKWVHITMLFIAAVMLARAFTSHFPNFSELDYAIKMLGIMNMAKDIGLAGAALFMAGLAWPGKS